MFKDFICLGLLYIDLVLLTSKPSWKGKSSLLDLEPVFNTVCTVI